MIGKLWIITYGPKDRTKIEPNLSQILFKTVPLDPILNPCLANIQEKKK